MAGTTKFSIAFQGAFGVTQAPMLAAIDDLRSKGFTIDTPQISDPTLNAQGVVDRKFDFTTVDQVIFKAQQAGAKVKAVGELKGQLWQIVASSDIKTCKDLQGKSVGVFAVGSFNDVSVRAYIGQNCPGTTVNMLTLGDSTARAAAMLAGRLDSSPLEIADSIALLKQAPDRFHILANFAENLPQLRNSFIVAHNDFLAQNPGTVEALLKAQLLQHRKVNTDRAYFKQIVVKYVPGISQANLDDVLDGYIKYKIFDPNGGLNEDNLNFSLQFFVAAGTIQPGLKVADISNFTYLQNVLKDIGRQ